MGGSRGGRGRRRARGRAAYLPLRADHRPARSCLLHAVRGLDRPARPPPVPQSRPAFGGPHLPTFASPAFYQVGGSIVPQFMAGLPMALAAAFVGRAGPARRCSWPRCSGRQRCSRSVAWRPGWPGRAGRRSRPWPSRSPCRSSTPAGHLQRAAGTDPVPGRTQPGHRLTDGRGGTARVCAGLGGLALGLTILVRIDGISDILPVVPYAGLLLIRRRPQAVPLVWGLSLGALAGLADGVLLSRPYLAHNKASVLPLAVLAGLVTILTAGAVPLLRRHRLPALDWSGKRGRWWSWRGRGPAVRGAGRACGPPVRESGARRTRPAAQAPGDHLPPLPAVQPALGVLVPGRARRAARGARGRGARPSLPAG